MIVSNVSIEIDSYVSTTKNINDIQKRSVGLVKNISGNKISVFFIGVKNTVNTDKNHVAPLDVSKTGYDKKIKKTYSVKICRDCYLLKENNEFEDNRLSKGNRMTSRPSCKVCRKKGKGGKFPAIVGKEKQKMDKHTPAKNSLSKCPLCTNMFIVGVTGNFVRDHNHDSGKGREWICENCNGGVLGGADDSTEFLQRVINYLKKHS